MSWLRPILNQYLRLAEKPHLRRAQRPEDLRRSFRAKARLFFHPPLGTTMEQAPLGTGEALWITPPIAIDATILLYFHGGGYVFGAPETHSAMLANLAKRAGAKAVLPRYPLAPEHPYPAAPDFAEAAYAELQATCPNHRIFVGGDSAGGGLALTLLARLLRKGAALPAGLFAFSPLTDLGHTGESFVNNAERDVELPAERAHEMMALYLDGADAGDPDVSPLFADFAGAPPVWITAGDTEILLDDSRRLVAQLKSQGVAVTYIEEHDLPHVWPIFHNTLPEARATLQTLADWIGDQAGSS